LVISLAKGIEVKEAKTMDELLPIVLPAGQPFALLGGAMLSEELNQGRVGFGVLGARTKNFFKPIEEIFKQTNLRLFFTDDIRSIALAGVLKNIYALGLGMADGLELGGNAKGWLTSKSIQEMLEIGKILGGRSSILLGPAGVGDFVATGFSLYSKNREVGKEIVRTGKIIEKSEGSVSLKPLVERLGRKVAEFDLLNSFKQIVINGKNCRDVFERLIA